MIGTIANATTLRGEHVQGRLVHVGRRRYGPRPDQRVAVLRDVRRNGPPSCWVCSEASLRVPRSLAISIAIDAVIADNKDLLVALRRTE